ncbi:hypothetical protein LR48_Vigan06g140400 [Vigna angularis]|uniref:Myosin motor domain-containing protein n=1 Tax=Phaseolus angularis TaxID=3914 RepID=A0A0L9UTN0_PHAAN|nr:hypothetical protein LR48_Vigan06g140400 [Vigna angularis]
MQSKADQVNFVVGSHVWVEDTELAWIDGEIQESNKDEVTILFESDTRVVRKSANMYPKDPEFPPAGVEDMTRLAYLHEPGLLQNLQIRYSINEIYTYTGSILIAVNPFQKLPHLTGTSTMEKYKCAAFGEQSPHPFAIASSAYSGESGAGKTESTKMLMQYLAFIGGRAETEGRSVEQQVLESNPVLEAFGNAKTVRNNNSSRFGKFVEIQFDQKGRISGAAIRTYLLERSRVCQVSDPERNYHCFYMLCAAPKEESGKYKLGDPRKFHYLNQSNSIELDGLDDSKEYFATKRAMEVVGISSEEQDAIFRVVAAILHLGNIDFVKGVEEVFDSCQPKDEKSYFHLKTAAELLMCDEKSLEESFCKSIIVTRGDTITKSLDPNSAALRRDSLAKIIYSRLFDWIMCKINDTIGQDPKSNSLIGVLDIYGFESFKTNSFEQFCINLANEKLQQHFNQHIFKMEQEEYKKEEIDWSYIEFVDNQDVIDLIEKKPVGIISLLDEACMFPRSTHETFAEKLYQTFKDNKRFNKPKFSRTDFTIKHYAGDVTYQTDLFLDKNKDYAIPEHADILNASKCSFVSGLFPPLPENATKSKKFSSVATQFKLQLQSLLETLNATEPHYIRCVKPNHLLKPGIFGNKIVLQQLRCGGVMEAIRISCAGYPTRKKFDEFVQRFSILEPEVLKECPNRKTACKRLLDRVNLKDYQIGKTKVFLRASQIAELDACRAEVLGRSASVIQRKLRTFLCQKQFISLLLSAIELQRVAKGQLARHQYECMRREAASLKIQKDFLMHVSREAYKSIYASAIYIQICLRGMVARNDLRFRKRSQAAAVIQGLYRGYIARTYFQRLKKATIFVVCSRKRTMARRELRKLKMAAKETKALEAAKNNLAKKVKDLISFLEEEKTMREATTQENEKLQYALQEKEVQLEAKTQEIENLKHVLQAKEVQFEEIKEAKKQETEKLRLDLQEMEFQFQEAKAVLTEELETAMKVVEQPQTVQELVNSFEKKIGRELPTNVTNDELNNLTLENKRIKERIKLLEKKTTLQEFPVNDEFIYKLISENEHLKEQISSLEKKITPDFLVNAADAINKFASENEHLKMKRRRREGRGGDEDCYCSGDDSDKGEGRGGRGGGGRTKSGVHNDNDDNNNKCR